MLLIRRGISIVCPLLFRPLTLVSNVLVSVLPTRGMGRVRILLVLFFRLRLSVSGLVGLICCVCCLGSVFRGMRLLVARLFARLLILSMGVVLFCCVLRCRLMG